MVRPCDGNEPKTAVCMTLSKEAVDLIESSSKAMGISKSKFIENRILGGHQTSLLSDYKNRINQLKCDKETDIKETNEDIKSLEVSISNAKSRLIRRNEERDRQIEHLQGLIEIITITNQVQEPSNNSYLNQTYEKAKILYDGGKDGGFMKKLFNAISPYHNNIVPNDTGQWGELLTLCKKINWKVLGKESYNSVMRILTRDIYPINKTQPIMDEINRQWADINDNNTAINTDKGQTHGSN